MINIDMLDNWDDQDNLDRLTHMVVINFIEDEDDPYNILKNLIKAHTAIASKINEENGYDYEGLFLCGTLAEEYLNKAIFKLCNNDEWTTTVDFTGLSVNKSLMDRMARAFVANSQATLKQMQKHFSK